MKKLFTWLVCCMPLVSVAQTDHKESKVKVSYEDSNVKKKIKIKSHLKLPDWAEAQEYAGDVHLYLRDYYTFYDPTRGYVYWKDGEWVASPKVPEFLSSVDLKKARMHMLNELPLEERPEGRYKVYNRFYPAKEIEGSTAQVPKVR